MKMNLYLEKKVKRNRKWKIQEDKIELDLN